MKRVLYLLLPIVVCAAPLSAIGQTSSKTTGGAGGEEEPPAVKISLHPAPEPHPALKYRLLPAMPDLIPGNAAVYYGKVTAEQLALFSDRELWNNISKWNGSPLEELRRDKVNQKLQFYSVYYNLERGARCESCDWQLPVGEGEFYSILLPEAQQTRGFARYLGARARAEIAEGEFDEAIHTLEIGYALGRHVTEGETLINGLIGIAICGMMSAQVQELIQQPDAPNLYWALSRLPRPLIDTRRELEAEMNAVFWSFPELRNAEDSTRDAQYWRQSLQQFWNKFADYHEVSWMAKRPEVLTALCVKGYPMAKRTLIQQGLDPERVEAMPVGQVVALYSMRTYEELRDDVFKWFYVPYWEAREKLRGADRRLERDSREGREILPIARVLVPSVQAVRTATARTDREIAVLRTLEALRIYGAAHGGQLPKTLGDVPEVPVPVDPVTGRPFHYELRGDASLLTGPPLPGAPLRLEIRFVK